ncbi:hypothetical protein CHUAL_003986 [Chamberlinius hualienensis]
MNKLKHYYLIIVSHGESDVEGIKLQISLEELWNHLNKISCQSTVDNIFWSMIHLDANQDNYMVPTSTAWTDMNDSDDYDVEEQTSSYAHLSSLEVVIHRLCNELPLSEFSVVEMVWITNSASTLPNFQNNIKLYGALKRLIRWYKARITVCSCEDTFVQSFSWGKALPLQIVQYPFTWNEVLRTNVFWRGGLHRHANGVNLILEGFQLRSTKPSDSPVELYDDVLTIVDEIPLHSIPPYMLSSEKFELQLPLSLGSSNVYMEKCWEFLSDVNARKDTALILSANFKKISVEKKNKDYKTWKQLNAEEKLDECCRNCGNNNFENCRIFVLIGDGLRTPYSASLLMLKDSSHFNFSTFRHWLIREAYTSCDCANEFQLEITKSLVNYSLNDVVYLEKCLAEWQNWMMEKGDIANESPLNRGKVIMATGAYIINKFKARHVRREISITKTSNLDGSINPLIQDLLKSASCPEKRLIKILKNAKSANKSSSSFMERLSQQMKSKYEGSNSFVTPVKSIKGVVEVAPKKSSEKYSRSLVWSAEHDCSSRDMIFNRKNELDNGTLENRYSNTATSSFVTNLDSESCSSLLSVNNFGKENAKKRKTVKVDERPRKADIKKVCRPSRINNRMNQCNELSDKHMQKLRIAVVDALAANTIKSGHKLFKLCARKLLEICKTFAKDVIGIGRTSEQFEKLALAHVQQVIQFHQTFQISSSKR